LKNKDKTNNSMSHYRTFEQAQEYIAKGFSVIPLRPKGKKPALDSWKEFQKRRPSGEELKKWFSNGSSNNIAIVTGSLSGIVVIDLDTLEAVQFAKENRFPATPTVKTGNGFHGYFLYREGIRSESGGKVFPGLHVKSEGGMATAPPSIHENGLPYEWVAGRGLDDIPFAPLPEIIVKKLLQRPPDRTPLREAYKGVDQGNRNDTLARLCGSWVNDGLTFQECMETATTWNERNNPPLPAREIETTVKSIFEKHHREKTKGIPIEPGINLTDLGNARRFVIAHAPDLRYCFPWGKWLAWDGRRWKIDDTGEPHRRAKDTIRRIYAEARDSRDEDERKRLATHALRSESDSKIKAMLSLAQSEPGIPILPDEMDSDPWVLNLANGTLELKTGILKPHRREDLITRLAPVEFRPETACPFWLEHLDRIFQKNPGLISFLQIAFGYSLTGLTDQRVLFIAHGAGANGKTTTQEVFAQILGDYAVRTPTESILVKRDAGIPNDLAKLKGARFVYCSEVEEGSAWRNLS
jgi:putative DNA primase/helicase